MKEILQPPLTFLIHQWLQKLATFTASPSPSVTRVVYSKEDLEARSYIKELVAELGLKYSVDAIGNTFIRWEGSDTELPAVATGSHIDAIPDAGQYDGTVGVLGGLEAIRILKENHFRPRRSIELILFTSEEPTRFGIGCLGSRMMSGQLGPEEVKLFVDRNGNDLATNTARCAFKGSLFDVPLSKNHYSAFIELHIEQGPLLEQESVDIGIVTKIAGPSSLKVHLIGKGGHAGAVMMVDRFDAGCAAAEISLSVERIARESASPDTVGTTGVFNIKPNAVNSIPKEALLEIDLRDTDVSVRDACLKAISKEVQTISERRNIQSQLSIVNCDTPAICDPEIVSIIEHAATDCGFSSKRMVSYAYHDTLFMNQICPTSMIFIPCRNGVSHRADEYSSEAQIEKGVLTLANTLKYLSE